MSLGQCIEYVFKSVKNLPFIMNGFSWFFKGSIWDIISMMKSKTTHRDITNVKDSIFMGWSLNFWGALIFSILTLCITSFS